MKSICWLSLFAFVGGCDKGAPEPEFPPLNEARSEHTAPRTDDSAAASAPGQTSDAGASVPADGWVHFERQDEIPYCLFARYADWGEAQYVKDAKPKTALKAGEELHFGVYAPRCAHPDCTRRVNMQCWADVVGTTITLHSRYNGEHYPANTCTKDCEPDTAACSTSALPTGTYTIEYGAHKKTLRIPGVVKPSCVIPEIRSTSETPKRKSGKSD